MDTVLFACQKQLCDEVSANVKLFDVICFMLNELHCKFCGSGANMYLLMMDRMNVSSNNRNRIYHLINIREYYYIYDQNFAYLNIYYPYEFCLLLLNLANLPEARMKLFIYSLLGHTVLMYCLSDYGFTEKLFYFDYAAQLLISAPEGDAAWTSCSLIRRDALKRKIEQRPSKQKLVTQHILLSVNVGIDCRSAVAAETFDFCCSDGSGIVVQGITQATETKTLRELESGGFCTDH
uniref:Protein-serine/threonine phosphatase n=1 Tax=Syphacia muris TaxID=451379 RepID=A0A0N5AA28_9BILA